jgi:hypothetical protein
VIVEKVEIGYTYVRSLFANAKRFVMITFIDDLRHQPTI